MICEEVVGGRGLAYRSQSFVSADWWASRLVALYWMGR